MNIYITYGIIFVVLLLLELAYFKIADKFNIIDKPNERSSHSTIVLRGGGIIFLLGAWVWAVTFGFQYPWFLLGLTLVAGVSFIDDIHSLPDSVRLVVQFTAAALAFYQLGMLSGEWFETNGVLMGGLLILLALIVYVGATNVINFMDGINGITAGYALAVLLPLAAINCGSKVQEVQEVQGVFFDQSLVIISILSVLVFCIFNFRPKGKAKCFAGDVGSIGIAFIMLFLIGKIIIATGDLTYLIFLLVYGVDGTLTICHRIMLHENLGEAHRKHAYQLMCNELKIGHVKVSLLYMALQLAVSLGFIYVCPPTVLAHWVYLIGAFVLLAVAYVLFKKKYYHLHEEYLASLKK
jgi:UDP-N-acetylmuramyl pentapeptide phosphotransferase/UDP-N-acetylglucosamine-1-phosphate transferase